MDGSRQSPTPLAGVTDGRRSRRWGRWIVLLAGLALIGGGVWAWQAGRAERAAEAAERETAPVTRGDLSVTITAVGTLQPRNVVSVGSELSGVVATVHAEANDTVAAGAPLADLDTSLLHAQAEQTGAAVRAAEASVTQARVNLHAAKRELERVRGLVAATAAAQGELDSAETTAAQAESSLQLALAQLAQARAAASASATNLRKAHIVSPIAGVVLERNVEPGQAVVSALQATTLFKVAEDLRHMELSVAIDEADVGQVLVGQRADFTVAAWPDRVFAAEVTKVHLSPDAGQQVVTYAAELSVENPDLVLLPGMTATVKVVARSWDDALLVPNAALRYTPPGDSSPPPAPREGRRYARVWIPEGDGARPVEVLPLATDGRHTVVEAPDLPVGTELVVAAAKPAPARVGPPHP